MVVGVDAVKRSRNLGDEVGESRLVPASLAFKVEVRSIEILGLDCPDQRGSEGRRSSGR